MIRLAWTMVGMALWVGCGGDRLRDLEEESPPQAAPETAGDPAGDPAPDDGPADPDDPPDLAPEPEEFAVELRLRGVSADGFSSLLVVADDVQVLVDGTPVQIQRRSWLVDLADVNHAERIATFSVPATATRVELKIELGAAGGYEEAGTGGWLDTRRTWMQFQSPVTELARTGRAVAVIDLSRSLIKRDGEGYLLVPQFRVY